MVNGLANFGPCSEEYAPPPCEVDREILSNFRIDDADEFHGGLEYEFGRNTIALVRVGAWLDPDHQMRYEPDSSNQAAAVVSRFAWTGELEQDGQGECPPQGCRVYELVLEPAEEEAGINTLVAPEDRLAARFTPGEDEVHITGGFGILPAGQRFQIDAAFDISSRADIFSISFVYYFERAK